MATKTMNIALTDELNAFVEEEVKSGNYGNTSEFFRDLLRERKKLRAQEKLEELLLEGLRSGEPISITPEYVKEKLERLVTKAKQAGKTKK
jgi:antitoxin ParD1/3/4